MHCASRTGRGKTQSESGCTENRGELERGHQAVSSEEETTRGMAEVRETMSDASARAVKAWKTRRIKSAWIKVRASEAASKESLKFYLEKRGWKVAFFEGRTGAPRTGIIDALAYRLGRKNSDLLEVKLIQLKGGKAGITGREIARLKQAAVSAKITWTIAASDGDKLQVIPEDAGEA